MNILVLARYQLTDTNKRTVLREINLVAGHETPELLIFYPNEIRTDQRICRMAVCVVEPPFENLTASYLVSDGLVLEEAIVEPAIQLVMIYTELSKYRCDRWKRLLEKIPRIDQDIEHFIQEQTGIEVVTDVESEPIDV